MCTAQLAFNGVGPLPMAAIKRARADLEGAADKGASEHQRRLEELCAASQVLPCPARVGRAEGCHQAARSVLSTLIGLFTPHAPMVRMLG